MKYNLTGDNLQFVTMEIQPGEMVWAEAGALVYMSGNINMEAKLQGGLLKGLKRTLAGESFMVTHFSSAGGPDWSRSAVTVRERLRPLILPERSLLPRRMRSSVQKRALNGRWRSRNVWVLRFLAGKD